MKTVIIPDIHQQHHVAEYIIRNEKPDVIIFLGDYFDSFTESADDTRETAKWLKWSIHQPNRIHCLGNHDIPYWFPRNKRLRCPGWNAFKQMLVNEHLSYSDFSKCVFFHNLDNKWFLSHAGVHPHWIVKNYKKIGCTCFDIQSLTNNLLSEVEKFIISAGRNNPNEQHWFYAWSSYRSGTPYPGGLFWNDFHGDFHSMIGINQLVGHTPDDIPRWIYLKKGDDRQMWYGDIDLKYEHGSDVSYNLCLDTRLKHYAIWNGQKLYIHSVKDLLKKDIITKK